MATQNSTKNKTKSVEQFKSALKRYSLKATPQRLAVHESMLRLGHASADMVTEDILSGGTVKIAVASVYNILSQLADIRVYRRRMSDNNKMYFDVNSSLHVHIYDCENHVYKDVFDDELMEIIEAHLGKKRFRGFRIEGIDIQLIARPTKKRYTIQH